MSEGAESSIRIHKELRVNSLKFEKQSSQLVVATEKGYRLVNYFDPARPSVKRGLLNYAIKLLELVPKTKILIYVTENETRKVNFYEYSLSSKYIEPKFYTQTVTAIKSSISRIAIAQEDSIYLYDSDVSRFMLQLQHIKLKIPNPQGLVDLSEHDFNTYLAYPSSDVKGQVEIFDCSAMKSKITFDAHVNPIIAISFSPTGRSLASASEKGTLIRIHIVFTGECVYEFRRSFQSTTINYLGFGLDSTYLSVTSCSTKIHIFKLVSRGSAGSGPGILMGAIQTATSFLPETIVKLLNQDRAFANALLPVPNMDTISMVHKIQNSYYLIVATLDGFVYTYSLDEERGGECQLLKAIGIEKDRGNGNDDEWVMI